MDPTTVERDPKEIERTTTLGNVRLRHEETNDIILVPTPSNDPNDPLNWSKAYRRYIAFLVCMSIFLSNFMAAGPAVSVVSAAETFFSTSPTTLSGSISKVAYLFTGASLLQGVGNLFWIPCIIKFGRRPVYVISIVMFTICSIWCGAAQTFASELVGRLFLGFFSGAAECLAPLTIADIFFLHERGSLMALYTASLAAGAGMGVPVDGLIMKSLPWRYIYWIGTALLGCVAILVIFTFPETEFDRASAMRAPSETVAVNRHTYDLKSEAGSGAVHIDDLPVQSHPPKRSYWSRLRIYSGILTKEPWWKLCVRPLVLIGLPPVLYATLVQSATIGFMVAISSNFAVAMQGAYGFAPWQSGLCFIGSVIGAAAGIIFGGYFSDWVADYFTRRNGGIREPEMRLPAILISNLMGPLALVLYGVGINNNLHWMVPTLGLSFLGFVLAQSMNVVLVYTIDSYRPIAGEITVCELGYKSCFGFLLGFYTNNWIAESGYATAFGTMAAICGGVILFWIPLFFFGKRIRHVTWHWKFVRHLAHWDNDREVGE